MLRSYRHIVFALVGWLSLAANGPEQGTNTPQKSAAKYVAPALKPIAAATNGDDKASQHDKPCKHGSDNRQSDLCAQWKAADAAQSSANATWAFGYVGSFLGLLTLAAAGAAAWYARKAAIHTEESAIETKRTADIAEDGLEANRFALRPHLTSTASSANPAKRPALDISFNKRNVGNTNLSYLKIKTVFSIEQGELVAQSYELESFVGTVTPGQEITINLTYDVAEDQWQAIEREQCRILIDVLATYTNLFEEEWTMHDRLTFDSRSLETNALYKLHSEEYRNPEREEKGFTHPHQRTLDLKGGS